MTESSHSFYTLLMELLLYHRWHCPYSKKVRAFIEDNHLEKKIQYLEIDESFDALERLVRLTGGQQTPCLVINGRPMLDSEKIIRWLKGNLFPKEPQVSV